jgi:preprotein translocase subunit YajC
MKRLSGLFLLLASPAVFADAPAAAAPASPGLAGFMPIVLIMVLFYFLLIRPQQKQAKEQQKMVDALKKGDRVLTQGGLYGVVSALKGKVLEVKISDEVKVLIARSAVTQVVQGDPAAETAEVVAPK